MAVMAVSRRSWRCRGDPTDIGPTRGSTAEVLKMFKVSAVPLRMSAMLTVFRGATTINDETTAELRRSWRCNCGLCRTSTAVVPRLRCDGGIMDTHASMEAHVNNVSRSAYNHLYNIGRISSLKLNDKECYLNQSAEQLVHAFITSMLDFCNALLCGLPSLLTQKLQRIQSEAARNVTRTSRSAHITPVLFAPYWLSVC